MYNSFTDFFINIKGCLNEGIRVSRRGILRVRISLFDMGSHKGMYSTQVFKYARIEDQAYRGIDPRHSNASRKIANKFTFQ